MSENTNDIVVDILCHSTLKPFGRTEDEINPPNVNNDKSIWNYDPVSRVDKITERLLGISRYTQSDFISAAKGKVYVLGVSLHAPEIFFFENKLGDGPLSTAIENFATQFGERRIRKITSGDYNYFDDINEQYLYLKNLDNTIVEYHGKKYKYIIVNSYSDIENALSETDIITIAIFLSIEGGHCLGTGMDFEKVITPYEIIEDNLNFIREEWNHKPLYITLAHHYYNELCGHAKSLPAGVDFFADQSFGMGTPTTEYGRRLIYDLLDSDKPTLIDIKHMSIRTRKEFYEILDKDFADKNIPILFSHGGVNGLSDFTKTQDFDENSDFNQGNISLFDFEIVRIAKSKGIIGINFDQRVMSSKNYMKDVKRHNIDYANILWNNIKHIAEVLDKEELNSWDNISIGTDFDGIINPIDDYWSEEYMPKFRSKLQELLSGYLENCSLAKINKLSAEIIVNKIMNLNALEFFKNNF